jgi:guanidinoacetate N-methyltransferase
MGTLAREVTAHHGDILEVGFGMGISANAIIANGCRSYTVIEAHPQVAENARRWAKEQEIPADVIEGFWQDVVPTLGPRYDGILFDTYPLSRKERHKNHFTFIPEAPRLLRQDGLLTLYSDETTDFRGEHLKLLLTHFDEVKLVKVTGLHPSEGCDYWHSDVMVVPVARKS